MNILFLANWFPYPADNGSKLRIKYLLRALSKKHSVTLLSFAFDTAQPDEADAHLDFCEKVHVVKANLFDRKPPSLFRKLVSTTPPAEIPVQAMTEKMNVVLAQNEFDVIIASTGGMVSYALQANANIPRILEKHNLLTHWMRDRYDRQQGAWRRARAWLTWYRMRSHEAAQFRQFDCIVLVSPDDQRMALNSLPGMRRRFISVIPNGVDCQHNLIRGNLAHPNALIYNGALTYQANYDAMRYFLEDIYPLIRERVPEIRLIITGSHKDVDLQGLALDESVHLPGFVEDIRPVVAGAHAAVIPIRDGGGTRLKILEAMALGVPVVSTPKGAEGLDVIDGQHLLLADDAHHFAQRTVELLQDATLRNELSQNARWLVEQKYDWQQIGEQFVQLVEATVRRAKVDLT